VGSETRERGKEGLGAHSRKLLCARQVAQFIRSARKEENIKRKAAALRGRIEDSSRKIFHVTMSKRRAAHKKKSMEKVRTQKREEPGKDHC